MAGTLKVLAGPAYISNAVANIYTPPASTIYSVIRHIHVCNVTTAAANFTLYIGATGGSAGGTELFKSFQVDANRTYDWYLNHKMLSTDFLTGVASAASTLTIIVDGEQVVV